MQPSTSLALTWIFSFPSLIYPNLCIPFFPFGNLYLLFSSTRWQNHSFHLISSTLSLSLTFCVSNLFERIIPSHLFFFLKSNFILSPRQADFRPGRSTLDQILYHSQSILDGFNKPKPVSRTICATMDFFKTFDFIWRSVLFYKLISARLASSLLFYGLNFFFLISALA